jgi:hypothetical protein
LADEVQFEVEIFVPKLFSGSEQREVILVIGESRDIKNKGRIPYRYFTR